MIVRVVILAAVIALTWTLAFAQRVQKGSTQLSSPEQEIERLERQRFNAYLKLDASALDRIMSDNYTSVYANGQVVTPPWKPIRLRSRTESN
jgi:hypothetical protein